MEESFDETTGFWKLYYELEQEAQFLSPVIMFLIPRHVRLTRIVVYTWL
jgi:hypothetical protein